MTNNLLHKLMPSWASPWQPLRLSRKKKKRGIAVLSRSITQTLKTQFKKQVEKKNHKDNTHFWACPQIQTGGRHCVLTTDKYFQKECRHNCGQEELNLKHSYCQRPTGYWEGYQQAKSSPKHKLKSDFEQAKTTARILSILQTALSIGFCWLDW